MSNKDAVRLISHELNPDKPIKQFYLDLAEVIAAIEGVRLTRKKLMGIAGIVNSLDIVDDAYDECSLRVAQDNAQSITGFISDGRAIDDGPLGRCILISADNLNSSAFALLPDLAAAQEDSLRQRISLEEAEIVRITRNKGGLTLLLFALQVNPEMTEERRLCYREAGYLLQLIDDSDDRVIDEKVNLSTLATILSPKNPLMEVIARQYQVVRRLFIECYGEGARIMLDYLEKTMTHSGLVIPFK